MASRSFIRNVARVKQNRQLQIGIGIGLLSKNYTYLSSSKQCLCTSRMACAATEGKPSLKETPLTTKMEESRRFMIDCFKAVGTPQDHAEIVADNLVEADYRGHYSHGMNRLEMYIKDILGGESDPKAKPTVVKESVATALCNGNNGLGAVVGKMCMDIAIAKACTAGIGIVVTNASNHYGIAGMYTLQAIKQGYIGLSFTNTSPFMAPTRSKIAALGTNPLSFGAPATNGDSFVLDMATTAVAVGKIELAKRKGVKLPSGWAMNSEGEIETDPEIAYNARLLMPVGGAEETSGYKGYGLGCLVEILCGILADSNYGPNVRKWGEHGKQANLGQCFIAINPNNFADGFEDRMSALMCTLRNLAPSDPEKKVLVAGDPERAHMDKVKADGGLRYVQNQHDTNLKLAEQLGVKPMESF